jgi:rod shape-determining protein MreC
VFKINRKNLISFVIWSACLLSLVFLISPLRSPFLNILKAPLKLSTIIEQELGGIIFYHRNLTQNEKLKKELDLFRYKLNAQRELYLENARLKQLLSFKKNSPLKLIAARVIARAPDNWSSSIIIDKGSYNGIRRGLVVINYLGLVGRVIEVSESASKISLIGDPNLGVSGIVQRSRQEGLVSGTLGSNLIMRYLPEEADIKINDIIITSGLNQTYPKGLLIGTVIDAGRELSGLSRFAVIRPAVCLSDIEEVLVIIQ